MTSVSLFHNTGLMTIVGSYLSPGKADALFNLFFSKDSSFTLFVQAIKQHTYCGKEDMRFIGKKCYAPEYRRSYLVIIKGCLSNLRELDFSKFKEPGKLALQLATDDTCAPIVYHSRYQLVHIKGEELRKVIDTLQNRPNIFNALSGEGIKDREKLKVALFQAIFKKCNSAQAEEYFPWAVWGPIAILDEEGA